MEYCPDCKELTKTSTSTRIDCRDCFGTGIGHTPDFDCGICKGRRYMIVEPFPIYESCDLPREA